MEILLRFEFFILPIFNTHTFSAKASDALIMIAMA